MASKSKKTVKTSSKTTSSKKLSFAKQLNKIGGVEAIDKDTFRQLLLNVNSEAFEASKVPKSAEDYARARDEAFSTIINGDANPLNCKGDCEINGKDLYSKVVESADKYTSAFMYRWKWCSHPTDRTWTFGNVRLRDLLFRSPSDDAGFKNNKTLMEMLQDYVNDTYGDGFKVVFKSFGGTKKSPPPGRKGASGGKSVIVGQTFQLNLMWGEPREKDGDGSDSD